MSLTTGCWLRGDVKQVADLHRRASAIAHRAIPVTNGREQLAIRCNCDMRLSESLWGCVEIVKGLAGLVLARVEHPHPEIDGGIFLSGTQQPILN